MNPFPRHATSNRIKTRNANPKFATRTLKYERDVHKTFASQSYITTHVRTRHVRHIFTPDDQTNQKLFISRKQYVKCNNSIPFRSQQKENSLDCCKQSIPFRVDLVYILVHFPKFSFINFVALNAEKSSSLHTIILKKHKQTKHLIILIFNQDYFSFH